MDVGKWTWNKSRMHAEQLGLPDYGPLSFLTCNLSMMYFTFSSKRDSRTAPLSYSSSFACWHIVQWLCGPTHAKPTLVHAKPTLYGWNWYVVGIVCIQNARLSHWQHFGSSFSLRVVKKAPSLWQPWQPKSGHIDYFLTTCWQPCVCHGLTLTHKKAPSQWQLSDNFWVVKVVN